MRIERDSNPRSPYGDDGFQDRCIKPLCHQSILRLVWDSPLACAAAGQTSNLYYCSPGPKVVRENKSQAEDGEHDSHSTVKGTNCRTNCFPNSAGRPSQFIFQKRRSESTIPNPIKGPTVFETVLARLSSYSSKFKCSITLSEISHVSPTKNSVLKK